MNTNLYVIEIPRSEVENGNIEMIAYYVKQLEKMKAPSQCVELTFGGYDDSTDEVFEIMDIRKYVKKMLEQFPEILYYASVELGTTTRLLACAYDVETATNNRMNAMEAHEYLLEHGEAQYQPVLLSISSDELLKIYANIKRYGIKRKDPIGAGQIVKELKDIFGR